MREEMSMFHIGSSTHTLHIRKMQLASLIAKMCSDGLRDHWMWIYTAGIYLRYFIITIGLKGLGEAWYEKDQGDGRFRRLEITRSCKCLRGPWGVLTVHRAVSRRCSPPDVWNPMDLIINYIWSNCHRFCMFCYISLTFNASYSRDFVFPYLLLALRDRSRYLQLWLGLERPVVTVDSAQSAPTFAWKDFYNLAKLH